MIASTDVHDATEYASSRDIHGRYTRCLLKRTVLGTPRKIILHCPLKVLAVDVLSDTSAFAVCRRYSGSSSGSKKEWVAQVEERQRSAEKCCPEPAPVGERKARSFDT